METHPTSTQVFSLRDYTELHKEGRLAGQPNSYLIIWITSNDGVIAPDGGTLYCLHQNNYGLLEDLMKKDGCVLFFPAHYLHTFRSIGIPPFFEDPFRITAFKIEKSCRSILEFLQLEIIQATERRIPTPLKYEMLRTLLKAFIIRLSCEQGESVPIRDRGGDLQFVRRFLELIEAHFTQRKTVFEYSDIMGVSSNYLNFKIKKATGFSAGYHIKQRVAIEAKRLAEENRLRAKEVAHQLGFTDYAHFSKLFKNLVGSSFTDYQRDHCALFM